MTTFVIFIYFSIAPETHLLLPQSLPLRPPPLPNRNHQLDSSSDPVQLALHSLTLLLTNCSLRTGFLEKEIAKDQIPMPDPKEIPNSPEPRDMILLEVGKNHDSGSRVKVRQTVIVQGSVSRPGMVAVSLTEY